MVTTIRAVLSAAMLFGFYVYAFGLVVLLGWLTFWVGGRTGSSAVAGKLGYLTLAVAAAILWATWKVIRSKPQPMPGLVLTEHRAPQLWAEVRGLARAVGTRVPDEIRLVGDVNAAVSENATLLGLRSGRRLLYVGMPLAQALTVSQLRAVLAHELGHYSGQHTRLGPLTYRGRATMAATIGRVGPTSLTGRFLLGYAWFYQLVSAAVSRRQEIEADKSAVRVAGKWATASALRELPGLSAAWAFYLDSYVGLNLDSGAAPAGVFANFPRLLQARYAELDQFRVEDDGGPRSRFDSHPPIPARVALIEREPDVAVHTDNRPALALFPSGDLGVQVESEVFDFGTRNRLPFADYTAAATQDQHQRIADVLYRAAARIGGAGNLRTVLELIASGRSAELATALGGPDAFASHLASALAVALVRSRYAGWQHSWSGPVRLVDYRGDPVALDDLTEAAGGNRVAQVARWLASVGVDVDGIGVRDARASAVGGGAIAGIVNAVVDGKRTDVVLLDLGLVLVPGMPRLKMKQATPRMHHMLTEVPPERLANAEGHRYVAYEDIASARVTKRLPATYELTLHDRKRIMVRWGTESEEMGDGWKALARVVGVVQPTA
ncbi:MAG TPA: M48 family metallopeptidase [Asanoa sp.]